MGRKESNQTNWLCFFFPPDSVQKSLERKFGRHGGAIPVTPSEDFEARIAVSF